MSHITRGGFITEPESVPGRRSPGPHPGRNLPRRCSSFFKLTRTPSRSEIQAGLLVFLLGRGLRLRLRLRHVPRQRPRAHDRRAVRPAGRGVINNMQIQ
jgi:hypothetical protein